MLIRDLHLYEAPGLWAGLSLAVSDVRKPQFRVEYASRGLVRVTSDGTPVLWARWHGGFDGFSWLRAAAMPRLFPPITAAVARDAKGIAARYARTLAPMLEESGHLHAGTWHLEPALPEPVGAKRGHLWPRVEDWAGERVPVLSIREPERAVHALDGGRWGWNLDGGRWLIGLRTPSPECSGRVKSLRKLAREGVLPPVVIYFVSMLDSWVLVDGHDRLLAATLEGVVPPMIALSAVREMPTTADPEAQAHLFAELQARFGGVGTLELSTARALSQAFRAKFPPNTFEIAKTRAWPIPGGGETWRSEVRERLSAVDGSVVSAASLLD